MRDLLNLLLRIVLLISIMVNDIRLSWNVCIML